MQYLKTNNLPKVKVALSNGNESMVPFCTRNIFEVRNGIAKVSLNSEAYQMVLPKVQGEKFEPLMTFTPVITKDKKAMRKFKFGEVEAFTWFDRSRNRTAKNGRIFQGVTHVYMKESDAVKNHIPVETREQEAATFDPFVTEVTE